MQLSAVVVVTLLASGTAGATPEPRPSEREVRYYVGSIGSRPIHMSLEFGAGENGKVGGWYSGKGLSDDVTESLALEGYSSPDGLLELEETSSEPGISQVLRTGRIEGRVDSSRVHVDGMWMQRRSNTTGARRPFHLVSFARVVVIREGREVHTMLEFQDRALEITPFANSVLRAQLEAEKARAGLEGRVAMVDFTPTFYSSRLIGTSVLFVRPKGNRTEGVVVGYVKGKLSTVQFEDLFRKSEGLQARVDKLVTRHYQGPPGCPFRVASFTVVGTGSIRIFGNCQPVPPGREPVQIDFALTDVADLLDPAGPLAELIQAAPKEGAGAKGAPQGSGTLAGGFRAGFDCAKASAPVEKLICSTERTATLDRELNGLFGAALKRNPAKAKELRARQKSWVAERDRKCAAATQAECLVPLYEARIEELRK